MFELLKKRIKNEKGLSLVELLAVIVILAIVAAIAIPAIGNIIENSRFKAAKSDALNIINAGQIYLADNNPTSGSVNLKTLVDNGSIAELGVFQDQKDSTTITVTKHTDGAYITGVDVDFSGDKNLTITTANTTEINNNGTDAANKDKSAKELLGTGDTIAITGGTK